MQIEFNKICEWITILWSQGRCKLKFDIWHFYKWVAYLHRTICIYRNAALQLRQRIYSLPLYPAMDAMCCQYNRAIDNIRACDKRTKPGLSFKLYENSIGIFKMLTKAKKAISLTIYRIKNQSNTGGIGMKCPRFIWFQAVGLDLSFGYRLCQMWFYLFDKWFQWLSIRRKFIEFHSIQFGFYWKYAMVSAVWLVVTMGGWFTDLLLIISNVSFNNVLDLVVLITPIIRHNIFVNYFRATWSENINSNSCSCRTPNIYTQFIDLFNIARRIFCLIVFWIMVERK